MCGDDLAGTPYRPANYPHAALPDTQHGDTTTMPPHHDGSSRQKERGRGVCVWRAGVWRYEAHATWVMMNKCGKCDGVCDATCSFQLGGASSTGACDDVRDDCVVTHLSWGSDSKRGGVEASLRLILVVWFRFSYFEEVP